MYLKTISHVCKVKNVFKNHKPRMQGKKVIKNHKPRMQGKKVIKKYKSPKDVLK